MLLVSILYSQVPYIALFPKVKISDCSVKCLANDECAAFQFKEGQDLNCLRLTKGSFYNLKPSDLRIATSSSGNDVWNGQMHPWWAIDRNNLHGKMVKWQTEYQLSTNSNLQIVILLLV